MQEKKHVPVLLVRVVEHELELCLLDGDESEAARLASLLSHDQSGEDVAKLREVLFELLGGDIPG